MWSLTSTDEAVENTVLLWKNYMSWLGVLYQPERAHPFLVLFCFVWGFVNAKSSVISVWTSGAVCKNKVTFGSERKLEPSKVPLGGMNSTFPIPLSTSLFKANYKSWFLPRSSALRFYVSLHDIIQGYTVFSHQSSCERRIGSFLCRMGLVVKLSLDLHVVLYPNNPSQRMWSKFRSAWYSLPHFRLDTQPNRRKRTRFKIQHVVSPFKWLVWILVWRIRKHKL